MQNQKKAILCKGWAEDIKYASEWQKKGELCFDLTAQTLLQSQVAFCASI